MEPLTFYLETSVWGSLARGQPRDRKQIVLRLLRLLNGVRAAAVISEVVLVEINAAAPDDAEQMRLHVKRDAPAFYAITDHMKFLAGAYISAGALPDSRQADALHVAAATCLELDYLVSWNHRHMTRPVKRLQYEAVNRVHGYLKTPLICNPFEAVNEIGNR